MLKEEQQQALVRSAAQRCSEFWERHKGFIDVSVRIAAPISN